MCSHLFIYTYIYPRCNLLQQNKSVVPRHQVRGRVKPSDWWFNLNRLLLTNSRWQAPGNEMLAVAEEMEATDNSHCF